jgi:ABC-type amino acid transport substrate-binding protein
MDVFALTTVACMRRKRLAGMVMVVLALSGCGLTMPTDPDGTLESVRGGTLNVGLSPNGDFTVVERDGTYSGSEVELVEGFATSLDSTIDWTVGSEEALVRGLENGTIDVVVAGLTDATPWVDKAGVTRAYAEVTGGDGSTHKMVMLVPIGENAFLTELETYLTESGEQPE